MVYMCHNFLIHSSADGHMGCFHVLAIESSAAMNTGYVHLFSTLFPQGICLVVGLLGRMVVWISQNNCRSGILSSYCIFSDSCVCMHA